MPEAYPTQLPKPLVSNYSNQEFAHFKRNDVQAGAPRYELLTDVIPTVFNVNFHFKELDFQIFEAWFKTATNYGVSSFTIYLLIGEGYKQHTCYFNQPYNVTQQGRHYNVSATLLGIEKQYNTDANNCDMMLLYSITCDFDKCSFFDSLINFGEVVLPDDWETINYGTDFS